MVLSSPCRVYRVYRTFLTWGSQASEIRLVQRLRHLEPRHLVYRGLVYRGLEYRGLEYRHLDRHRRVLCLGISNGPDLARYRSGFHSGNFSSCCFRAARARFNRERTVPMEILRTSAMSS